MSLTSQPHLLSGGRQLGFSLTDEEFVESLLVAKELGVKVNGLCLTVNSNWSEGVTVEDVFYKAKDLILMAESMGFTIDQLTVPEIIRDISVASLETFLHAASNFSEQFFANRRLKIFCETLDSITTAALTIFMTVQAVRRIKMPDRGEEKVQYFVDDGRHNSFRKVPRTVRYSDVHFVRRNSMQIIERDNDLYPSEVFGPSCDGDDIVVADFLMPELRIGDLIYLTNVGSDTIATRTNFNGFLNCNCNYFMSNNDLINEMERF